MFTRTCTLCVLVLPDGLILAHSLSSLRMIFSLACLTLQRHLQNMLFSHKGLRMYKKPLSLVVCDRKTAILRVHIWSTHESDVVGIVVVVFATPPF
jgi:hypothetical protein